MARVARKKSARGSTDQGVLSTPASKTLPVAEVRSSRAKAVAPPSIPVPPFEFRRRQSRAERQAETRIRVLMSAKHVFQVRGYHPASLDEIAEAAGYSKGAVYSNFPSKDDLFLELLDQVTDERIQALEKLFKGAKDLDDSLRGLEIRWREILDAERPWSHVEYEFALHALRYPELAARLRENHNRLRAAVAKVLQPFLSEQDAKELGSTKEIVSAIMAVVRGVTFTNLQDPAMYRPSLHALLVGRLLKRR
jgi:AcrR family transcriptional regulator